MTLKIANLINMHDFIYILIIPYIRSVPPQDHEDGIVSRQAATLPRSRISTQPSKLGLIP